MCSSPESEYYFAASNTQAAVDAIAVVVERACIAVADVCTASTHCAAGLGVEVSGKGFLNVPSRLGCRIGRASLGASAATPVSVSFSSATRHAISPYLHSSTEFHDLL